MSMIIRRAKERFADRGISPATLGIGDARTDDDRDRRNDFYRGHGFVCAFPDDPDQRVGHVYAKRIGDLVERVNSAKVTFIPPDDLFRQFVKEFNNHVEASRRAASLQASLDGGRDFYWKRLRGERYVWLSISATLLIWALFERLLS